MALLRGVVSDIVPALVEVSKVASEVSAILKRGGAGAIGRARGAEKMRVLFDPGYAESVNWSTEGNKSKKWVDGTPGSINGLLPLHDTLTEDERLPKLCQGKTPEQLDARRFDACRATPSAGGAMEARPVAARG